MVKVMVMILGLTLSTDFGSYAEELSDWISRARTQQAQLTGEDPESIPDSALICETGGKAEERLISAYSALPDSETHEVWIIGKDIVPVGICLKAAYGENVVYSNDETDVIEKEESVYRIHRFLIRKRSASGGETLMSRYKASDVVNHWEEGEETDVLLGESRLTFTCIDSDFYGKALFLCNSVIPADFGSVYGDEGILPGPARYFGETNDYGTSLVKTFLDQQSPSYMCDIKIGISESATGSTEEGKFGLTTGRGIKSYPAGSRELTGKLFLLSLDEALTYSDRLWKFTGSSGERKTSAGAFAGAYWLRTPYGDGKDQAFTDMVYVVDLEKGNIHPARVMPDGSTGDVYTDAFTSVGIRPAFVLDND